MIPQRLVPFASTPALAAFQLEAEAERCGSILQLRYRLAGPLEQLAIATPAAAPERRDGLWQATCFEAFWAEAGAEPYWELNLSPAGHWNLYRLDGYRQGLAEEQAFSSLPFQIHHGPAELVLVVELPLPPALGPQTPLELAITAVLAQADGNVSFWALVHPGSEADFHRRDGFLLEL